MSARADIIDKLADNIDFESARLLGMRAGVAARFFGGEKDAQARFTLILEHLERSHSSKAFAHLFDVVRKDHPRTVAECERILSTSPDHESVRAAHASRPVRVIANGRPVSMLAGRGAHQFTVQIGARSHDEPAPELEIVGELPTDTIDRTAATLECGDRPEWWEIAVSFTRNGFRARSLALRVTDETAPTESTTLTLVDKTALLVARIYFAFACVLCAATFAIAFGHYAGSRAPLLALVFPIGTLAAGASTLLPRFARFGIPAHLFAIGSFVLAIGLLPGNYLVAVENQTDHEIVIGQPIATGAWVTMSPARAEAATSTYCMTAATRGFALLPWRAVTKASPRWTVVEDTFPPEVIANQLRVDGGTRDQRTLIVSVKPPDCTSSTAQASLRDYLAADIQIPYGWTLSSFTENGRELLKLVHVFGAPRVDFSLNLVVTTTGALSCAVGSPIVLEPLPDIPGTSKLEITSEGDGGTASHWRSTSSRAWRCRLEKTKVNSVVLATSETDFDLPTEMGAARLTIGGQKIDVPADARKIKRRSLANGGRTEFPRGAIDLDGGGKAVIDANHMVMAVKDDAKQTFRKNDQDFEFEVKDKTSPLTIHKHLRLRTEPRFMVDPDPTTIATPPTRPTTIDH